MSASHRNSAAELGISISKWNGLMSMCSSQHSPSGTPGLFSGPGSGPSPLAMGLGPGLSKKMSTASAPSQFLLELAAARRGSFALAATGNGVMSAYGPYAYGPNATSYGPAYGTGTGDRDADGTGTRRAPGDCTKRQSESAISAMPPTIAAIEIGGIEITALGESEAPEAPDGEGQSQRESRNSSGATNSSGYWGSMLNNSGSSSANCNCNSAHCSAVGAAGAV